MPATFLVVNADDAGAGSLRQAIVDANANPGADAIHFAIPGSGVHTIAPTQDLPVINDTVTIDGYTQPGSSRNTLAEGTDAVLTIELRGDGIAPGSDGHGLVLTSPGSAVRGLTINRFGGYGILVGGYAGGAGVTIQGNFLGTDPTGRIAAGNGIGGVQLDRSLGNVVGGLAPVDRNLISGNQAIGINVRSFPLSVVPGTGANLIVGNLIGTDATGRSALGNGRAATTSDEGGIVLQGSLATAIGGDEAGASNVISSNGGDGISLRPAYPFLSDPPGTAVEPAGPAVIRGNAIGTDRTGQLDLGNEHNGILVRSASAVVIGGTSAGARNTIRFNGALSIFPIPSPEQFATNTLTPNRDQLADLAVTATLRAATGDKSTLSFVVVNRGPSPALGATLSITLPYVGDGSAATDRGTVVPVGNLFDFYFSRFLASFGDLPAGASATVTFTLFRQPRDGQAELASRTFDVNPDDNRVAKSLQTLDPDPPPSDPPPEVTPPVVQAVAFRSRPGSRRAYEAVMLSFSAPLSPADAQDLRNYRLILAGRDGRLGTRDDRVIRLRSAAYDPSSSSVNLRLKAALPKSASLSRLIASGPGSPGLYTSAGLSLDGDRDGLAGGSFVADIGQGPRPRGGRRR